MLLWCQDKTFLFIPDVTISRPGAPHVRGRDCPPVEPLEAGHGVIEAAGGYRPLPSSRLPGITILIWYRTKGQWLAITHLNPGVRVSPSLMPCSLCLDHVKSPITYITLCIDDHSKYHTFVWTCLWLSLMLMLSESAVCRQIISSVRSRQKLVLRNPESFKSKYEY